MWQSLLFSRHYHYYPDVDSHPQLSVRKYPLPNFAISPNNFYMVVRKMRANLVKFHIKTVF